MRKTVSLAIGLAVACLAMTVLAAPAVKEPIKDRKEPRPAKLDPGAPPAAEWIWLSAEGKANQTVYFRTAFDLGPIGQNGIKSARVWTTCDNQMTLFLNGRKVLTSTEWTEPKLEDVRRFLIPGKNVIAVQALNTDAIAGLILKLSVNLDNGRNIEVATSSAWRLSETAADGWETAGFNDTGWKAAFSHGKYGMAPWGNFGGAINVPGVVTGKATPASEIKTLPGFKIELLYSVPKTQDTWVAMTPDPKGRLIVSGQNGPLFRVTPGADESTTKVEKIDLPIGHAQGLLYVNDALYVVVNGGGIKPPGEGAQPNSCGLYRVTDTDGDDKLDKIEKLKAFKGRGGEVGGGEHGPHAVRLGPDGKLYVTAGNFTSIPDNLASTSPCRNYAEDLLLPRNPDGGGHDPQIMAPAGAISRCDLNGQNWEVFCIGLRNTYDFDFNSDGEILLYDSDMEWDTGTPWYRPTRVLHPVSGAEFGWRNGTGKWPDYYPDSLPAVANTGLGSPTGVNFGYGAKFPAKYQRAFFIDDWAYGKVYAVHITPHGASYTGTFEPFLVGKPFNVTDICINTDGNMYITIGGRGTQSGLYRVSYTGNEPTTPAPKLEDPAAAEARALRKQLEAFHGKTDPAAVDFAWPHLNSPDRYIRYAARIAIEWQPVATWQEKALAETRPTAAINALLALIRNGDKSLQPRILEALGRIQTRGFTEEQVLEMIRTLDMCFIRMGKLDEFTSEAIANQIIVKYPAPTFNINRELVQILAYLDCPQVVTPTMKLLAAAKTQEEQLHYVLALRVVNKGWTLDQRKAYFSWMNLAESKYIGGHSFKNFIKRIREDAVKTLTPEEKAALEPILKGTQNDTVVEFAKPRQFVWNYQMDDLLPDIDKATKGRSFERGHQVFLEAQCMTCHRFGNEGGGTGPDLTGVGNRFAPTDVLEAILLPSKVISDQYQPTELLTKDKDVIIGQIESEDADKVIIRTNPLAPDPVTVPKANIVKRRPSRVSIMPSGMVDNFSKEEILDLIAYLRSGGDKNDKAFKN